MIDCIAASRDSVENRVAQAFRIAVVWKIYYGVNLHENTHSRLCDRAHNEVPGAMVNIDNRVRHFLA